MSDDVAIIGAGPAGLACAIGLRLRGLTVVLFERGTGARDKACGEGLMPVGIAHLEALGVVIPRAHRIAGIRYINEDGSSVAAALPSDGGLGIRRLVLSEALRARALAVGVALREGHRATLAQARQCARFVIAADGLHSPLRAEVGLAEEPAGLRRYGMRRHFAMAPWTDHVEVYFADEVEAYVTPVAPDEVGVAFLWRGGGGDFDRLLDRFPLLAHHLLHATPSSPVMGRGPLEQRVISVVADDFALVGDAAGYVDAITGEGVTLALDTAAVLVDELARKRTGVMSDYARYHRRVFRSYDWLTRALLFIAARPTLRRQVIRRLPPATFTHLLRVAIAS